MKFFGSGGEQFVTPQLPKEELEIYLSTKDDIVVNILSRIRNDCPIFVGNIDSKDVVNRHLAKVTDILASVVSNPYPTEPEVIPRFLGFSVYTITEPRGTEEVLDEVDSMVSGEVRVLFPKLGLKPYPDEGERRRLALFGRGNQVILNELSSWVRTIYRPNQFVECLSFMSDWENADYFLLVELSAEDLADIGFSDTATWQHFVNHLEREWLSFSSNQSETDKKSTNEERGKQ